MNTLPAEVLVEVLGKLELAERHQHAALVCTRWRQAANSPQLLQTLDICVGPSDRFLPRLRSLAEWVALRAVAHVQNLRLELNTVPHPHVALELPTVLAGMVAACSGGQLTALTISLKGVPLAVSSWLAPVGSSLQQMDIRSDRQLAVTAPLLFLSSLRHLRLAANVGFSPAARLPTSLTSLTLSGVVDSGNWISQVGALPGLEQLTLGGILTAADAYAPLTQLTQLTSLRLAGNHHLPACLSQLSFLNQLLIGNTARLGQEDAGVVRGALGRLTSLKSLLLSSFPGLDRPPIEMANLAHLHDFQWCAVDMPADAALPGGAWVSSLQALTVPAVLLGNSLQQLAAATKLQLLQLTPAGQASRDAALPAISAVQRFPSLRGLLIECASMPPDLCTAVLELQRCRSRLHISVVGKLPPAGAWASWRLA